jgi:hypothetical protein
VAVDEATTAYKLNGSLPVVGTNTGVFAAIGNPVVVVTPAPPMNAAALEETNTPSVSGALPIVGSWVVEIRDDKGIPGIDDEQSRIIRGLLHDLRAGRRHVNAELLQQVAAVYWANFNKAPAEAVARTFGVKQRMAHEYVRRARKRGFLPPTTQGKKKI